MIWTRWFYPPSLFLSPVLVFLKQTVKDFVLTSSVCSSNCPPHLGGRRLTQLWGVCYEVPPVDWTISELRLLERTTYPGGGSRVISSAQVVCHWLFKRPYSPWLFDRLQFPGTLRHFIRQTHTCCSSHCSINLDKMLFSCLFINFPMCSYEEV